jgi:hypothetical protein
MLRAEKSMRDALALETLASLAQTLDTKAPKKFGQDVHGWLDSRSKSRRSIRMVQAGNRKSNNKN